MKILFSLIFLSNIIMGQELGFATGGVGINTGKTFPLPVPLTSYSILGNLEIAKNLNAEVRVSYEFLLYNYIGPDLTGTIIYHIIKPVFISSGITLHLNEKIEAEGVFGENIFLIDFGAGIDLTKHMAFEIYYSLPFKVEPWIYSHDATRTNFWSRKLYGVIKFNFKFHWQL